MLQRKVYALVWILLFHLSRPEKVVLGSSGLLRNPDSTTWDRGRVTNPPGPPIYKIGTMMVPALLGCWQESPKRTGEEHLAWILARGAARPGHPRIKQEARGCLVTVVLRAACCPGQAWPVCTRRLGSLTPSQVRLAGRTFQESMCVSLSPLTSSAGLVVASSARCCGVDTAA